MLAKLRAFIKTERFREMFLYLVVGGLTTVVSYVSYFLITRIVSAMSGVPTDTVWLGTLGTAFSWCAAVAFAFYPNKKYVFKSTDTSKKQLFSEIKSFVTARLLSLGVDAGMMAILMGPLGVNDLLSKLITQIVIVVLNYFASKFWIFRKKHG